MNNLEEVINKIKHLQGIQKTILICIDGYGGSGKSSLAKSIKEKILETVIIEMDDFYSPEFKRADFKRVLEEVIKPLREGQIANFQIYDWQNDRLIPGKTILPDSIVIIEGVYSMAEELLGHYDIKIWVECPPEIGLKRGLDRDKKLYGVNTTDKWLNDWMPREKEYIESQKPKEKADFIIDGVNIN